MSMNRKNDRRERHDGTCGARERRGRTADIIVPSLFAAALVLAAFGCILFPPSGGPDADRAVGADIEYNFGYHMNGGYGGTSKELPRPAGTVFTTIHPVNVTPPIGKQFKEWNSEPDCSGDGYAAGAEVVMPAHDLTLYAIWEDIPEYYFGYHMNGGYGGTSKELPRPAGAVFTTIHPVNVTPPIGKQFKEWNSEPDGSGDGYAAGAEVVMPAHNLTLYAIWEDIAGSGGDDDDGDGGDGGDNGGNGDGGKDGSGNGNGGGSNTIMFVAIILIAAVAVGAAVYLFVLKKK